MVGRNMRIHLHDLREAATRYAVGVIPVLSLNARKKDVGVPKPQRRATSSSDADVLRSECFAHSIRPFLKYLDGLSPTSSRNWRVN